MNRDMKKTYPDFLHFDKFVIVVNIAFFRYLCFTIICIFANNK